MRDRPLWIDLLAVAVTVATVLTPARSATVDADPFTSTAAQVERWHRAGRIVHCRLNPARWEPYQPDAARFGAVLLGPAGPDGGRWLDLRQWDQLRPLLDDRLSLCAAKGFDGVTVPARLFVLGTTGIPLNEADRNSFADRFTALTRAHRLEVSRAGGDAAGSADTSTTSGS